MTVSIDCSIGTGKNNWSTKSHNNRHHRYQRTSTCMDLCQLDLFTRICLQRKSALAKRFCRKNNWLLIIKLARIKQNNLNSMGATSKLAAVRLHLLALKFWTFCTNFGRANLRRDDSFKIITAKRTKCSSEVVHRVNLKACHVPPSTIVVHAQNVHIFRNFMVKRSG